jgi:uncharacterized protein (DUF2336 family)
LTAQAHADPEGVLNQRLSYEQARDLARSQELTVRMALAGRTDVAPEILYFLAQDPDRNVRVTVAANPAAPPKADQILVGDAASDVREALASKVAMAEERGGAGQSARQKAIARDVLDRLSLDSLTAVRAAIAEGLKALPSADHALINRLARDVEILVAAPILEYSPVLREEDLLDIIRSSPVQGALAAISRRRYVDPAVTDAIVASGDSHAITHLLYNANAHLQEHTLDSIIESAGAQPDWQPPLIHRPELVETSIRRLAAVVADNLLDRLMARQDLSPDAARDLRQMVDERMWERFGQPPVDGGPGPTEVTRPAPPPASVDSLPLPFAAGTAQRYEPLLARARLLLDKGKLDESALTVALLTDDIDGLVCGLAVRASLGVQVVLNILASQSARAICALAWGAGLTARFALELQVKLGRVAYEHAIRPGLSGAYQPSEAEMRWQIEMYADG